MPGISEGPIDPLRNLDSLDSIWGLTPDEKEEDSSLLEFLGTHFEALSGVEHKKQLLHIRKLARQDLKSSEHREVFEFLDELFQTSKQNELTELSLHLKNALEMAEKMLLAGDPEKGKLAELLQKWQANSKQLAERLEAIQEGLQYLTEGQVKGFLEELCLLIGDLKKESLRLTEEWKKVFMLLHEALEKFQKAIREMIKSQKPISRRELKDLEGVQQKASKQFSSFIEKNNNERAKQQKKTTGFYQKLHKHCHLLELQKETHLDFFKKIKKELLLSQKDDWRFLIEPRQKISHDFLNTMDLIYSLLDGLVEESSEEL